MVAVYQPLSKLDGPTFTGPVGGAVGRACGAGGLERAVILMVLLERGW
jgi:hypothetical protein